MKDILDEYISPRMQIIIVILFFLMILADEVAFIFYKRLFPGSKMVNMHTNPHPLTGDTVGFTQMGGQANGRRTLW